MCCSSFPTCCVILALLLQAVALPAAVITGAMAADNLAMAGLLALLLTCPLHLLGQKLTAAAAESATAAAAGRAAGGGSRVAAISGGSDAAVGQANDHRDIAAGDSSSMMEAQLKVPDLAPSASFTKTCGGWGSKWWGFPGWAGSKGQLALDGQPLLTEEPSFDQVNACMAAAKTGRSRGPETQQQLHGGNSSLCSSSSSVKGLPGDGYGPQALDGQPLYTELPATAHVFAALQAARRGESSPSSSADFSPSSSRDGSETAGIAAAGAGGSGAVLGRVGGARQRGLGAAAALGGQSLLTEPPSAAEVAAAIEAARRGENSSSNYSSGSSTSSWDGWPGIPSPISSSGVSWDEPDYPAAAGGSTWRNMGGVAERGTGVGSTTGTSWHAGSQQSQREAAAGGGQYDASRNGTDSSSSSTGSGGNPSSNGRVDKVPAAGSKAVSVGGIRGGAGTGPRALDGGPLLTEEPSAAAVASAMHHARSGSSISSVSSLSSVDGREGGSQGLWCPPPAPQAAERGRVGPWGCAPAAAGFSGGAGAGCSMGGLRGVAQEAGSESSRVEGSGSLKGSNSLSTADGSSSSSSKSSELNTSKVLQADASPNDDAATPASATTSAHGAAPSTESLSAAVAAAAVAVAAGKSISVALGMPGLHLMAMTGVAMGVASLATWLQQRHQQQQQLEGQGQGKLMRSPEPTVSYFAGMCQCACSGFFPQSCGLLGGMLELTDFLLFCRKGYCPKRVTG